MTIRFVTSTVQDTILSVPTFGNVFNGIIITELLKLQPNQIDDYAVLISIKPDDHNGSIIVFHDGGATWDDDLDDMVQKDYIVIKTLMRVEHEYDLYFDMDDEILCFLHER